jgi:hypothetical protein
MMTGKEGCHRLPLSIVKTDSEDGVNEGQIGSIDIEGRIVQSLDGRPGSSISEIAKWLSINRSTASKYLHVLKAKGLVHCRQVGPVKLWSVIQGGK